jgi:hypothetical protein
VSWARVLVRAVLTVAWYALVLVIAAACLAWLYWALA